MPWRLSSGAPPLVEGGSRMGASATSARRTWPGFRSRGGRGIPLSLNPAANRHGFAPFWWPVFTPPDMNAKRGHGWMRIDVPCASEWPQSTGKTLERSSDKPSPRIFGRLQPRVGSQLVRDAPQPAIEVANIRCHLVPHARRSNYARQNHPSRILWPHKTAIHAPIEALRLVNAATATV